MDTQTSVLAQDIAPSPLWRHVSLGSIHYKRMHQLWAQLDARWFQILFLLSFLGLGTLARDFSLNAWQVLFALLSGLVTQSFWLHLLNLPSSQTRLTTQYAAQPLRSKLLNRYLSVIITTCGVCILVRASNLWAHPLLMCIAISSKFLLRGGPVICKSHVFNPANLAAVIAAWWLSDAWISPGQWGTDSLTALWFIALGGLVTQRVSRWGVSLAFLGAWAMLLATRLLWLGYSWNPGFDMWCQQMCQGSVLLFAFFMISDPMTTPQNRLARIAYAALVALGAFVWQFVLYKPNGLLIALFASSMLVPLINGRWPAQRFDWARPKSSGQPFLPTPKSSNLQSRAII